MARPALAVPHGDANMLDAFMTTVDREYTGAGVGNAAATNSPLRLRVAQGSASGGHSSNQALIPQRRTLDHAMDTTNHVLMSGGGRRPLTESEWRKACIVSAQPSATRATAFVRVRSMSGPNATSATSGPFGSTTRTTFTNSGAVQECQPSMFSGNDSRQFKRTFLHCGDPSSDDPSSAAASRAAPHHQGGNGSRPESSLHAGRRALLHTSMLPGTYFQHSRLIGDRSLARPGQLPVALSNASTYSATLSSGVDAKSLVSTLAGRPASSGGLPVPFAKTETNPILLSAKDKDGCRVSHRIECQGNVAGSTYRAHYVNQQLLPELADPSPSKGARDRVSSPHALPPVQIGDAQGTLFSQRPAGIHPTAWAHLVAMEVTQSVDKRDPYAHKKREAVLIR